MLGEVCAHYPNALAEGTQFRMFRTVNLKHAPLFQQERQKHLLFHVPGHLLADPLITGLGGS